MNDVSNLFNKYVRWRPTARGGRDIMYEPLGNIWCSASASVKKKKTSKCARVTTFVHVCNMHCTFVHVCKGDHLCPSVHGWPFTQALPQLQPCQPPPPTSAKQGTDAKAAAQKVSKIAEAWGEQHQWSLSGNTTVIVTFIHSDNKNIIVFLSMISSESNKPGKIRARAPFAPSKNCFNGADENVKRPVYCFHPVQVFQDLKFKLLSVWQ